VGADVAKRQGWLTKSADVKAIASHTFGAPRMSVEQKILYVADFSSDDRTYPKAKKVRRLALKNLEQGFALAVSFKIKNQMRKMRFIHPVAVEMWNNCCAVKLPE
jgi:HD superfamily phosphohydrolase YqeK